MNKSKKTNVYLDTNILFYLKEVPDSDSYNLYCSQLGIMEILAGMTSEKEYKIRKIALKRIIERGIKIIWHSPKTLLIKAFGLPLVDYDVIATMILMQKVLETEKFCEIESIIFPFGGEEYSIKTFTDYDHRISEEYSTKFGKARELPAEIKKEARALEISPEIVALHANMCARQFLIDNGYRDGGIQFKIYLDNYQSSNLMKNGISFLSIYNQLAIANNYIPGRNDGHDIAHLSYTDSMDLFISNDRIFNKFKKYSSLKFLSLPEFIQEINNK